MACRWLLATALLLTPAAAVADREPPVADRPEHFSGAAGVYRITASAEPTEVAVEDPLTLTVTVQGKVSTNHPELAPRRLKLRVFGNLEELFQVDDLPEKDSHPDGQTWNFVYRLRPRNTGVEKIPRLRFVYWNSENDTFQTAYSSSIPLRVKPRPKVAPPEQGFEMVGDLAAQYPLATGPDMLAKDDPEELPGPVVLGLLFLAPPVLCLAWYVAWLRWFPDAARLAGRRRSRAARLALKKLAAVPAGKATKETAERVVAIVCDYLHQRLELTSAEPTPGEVAGHLEQAGVSAALAGQFAALLDACAATRFAPDPVGSQADLARAAARLIRQLEAEPCLCKAS
jgi:hypothetical protein